MIPEGAATGIGRLTDVACASCVHFRAGPSPHCAITARTPIRQCVIAINREFAARLRPGARLLEVGCGSWSHVFSMLPPGVSWHGIDVRTDYEDSRTLATTIASVARLPYAAASFTAVLANQSVEHWFEFGVTLRRGMNEVARVLEPGGEAWINVPIHRHGHSAFLTGRIDGALRRMFDPRLWDIERVEAWRRIPDPLPPYEGWRDSPVDARHLVAGATTSWILNIVGRRTTAPVRRGFAPVAYRVTDRAMRWPWCGRVVRAANRGPYWCAGKVVQYATRAAPGG